MLEELRITLATCQTEMLRIQKDVDSAYVRHCSNLDATDMHAVIQLYAQVKSYKNIYDHDDMLNDSRADVLGHMQHLKCNELGGYNSRDLFNHFKHLDKSRRTQLLDMEPNGAEFADLMRLRMYHTHDTKVSSHSMFSEQHTSVVHRSTMEKRRHLIRQRPAGMSYGRY